MNVIVYTKPNCPHCDSAKHLLSSANISYTPIEMGKDCTREEILEQFPTARTMPIITIDNEYIGGYNELKQYLGGQGE